jgi:hemolysin activation/secretion protein
VNASRPPSRLLGALGLGLTLAAAVQDRVAAQPPPPTPRPGVSPDRPDERPPTVRRSVRPSRAPPASSAPRLAASFVLQRVEIEGSSLPPQVLAAAYAPFIGRTIDGAGLKQITDALAAVYARSDIALYSILAPSQSYEGGLLRLQAQEGYVQTAVIKGAVAPKVQRLIGRYAGPIAAERPLRKATLERYVSLIRDIPGFAANIQFERGDQPAAVRMVVDGRMQRLQLAAGVNNRGTAVLGKIQGQIDVLASSLAVGGDQLRVGYARPLDGDFFRAINASYFVPLKADGLSLAVSGGHLTTEPRGLPLKGEASNLGAQISYQALRSFDRNLSISAGLDGVNSDNAFLGFTFASERTRALRLSAYGSRQNDASASTASLTLSSGVPDLGARLLDPTVATDDFRKWNLRLADNRKVGPMLLRTAFSGQTTGDRLPGTEQFAAGGDEFGRAYETAIISGDRGYAASGELAWRPTKLPAAIAGSEVYGFVDGAWVRYLGRHGLSDTKNRLASIGAGGRLTAGRRTVLQVEAVRGLHNPVTYENREVWRVVFSLRTLAF